MVDWENEANKTEPVAEAGNKAEESFFKTGEKGQVGDQVRGEYKDTAATDSAEAAG